MAETAPSRARSLALVCAIYSVALAAAVVACLSLWDRSALLAAGVGDLAATVVVFAGSLATDNSSVYDPYWSVAPLPIAIFWAWDRPAVPLLRRVVVVSLVCLWGIRLTANWIARWRGLGDEDFRYVEIRGRSGRFYWPASFFGIHLMPTIWVFLGLLPAYAALAMGAGRPLGWLDAVATLVTASAIGIETLADLQLRRFIRARSDPEAVLASGLWSLSRHPNYVGEVLFWWGLYLFGVAANPGWAWTVVGPLSITLLFLLVSVPWMDRRMASRHPTWLLHAKRP